MGACEWEHEVGNFFLLKIVDSKNKIFHGSLFLDYMFCKVGIVGTEPVNGSVTFGIFFF